MQTTVNLPDGLLREARELARREQTTLTELLETGLRAELAQRAGEAQFRLTDASVSGRGLTQEFRGAGGQRLREASYRGPA